MKQESRKEEIVRVAAKLFKEKGYSAVTMRDLAKAMGIKAASLYNHIKSKQDILKTIIISLAEEFTEGMQQIQASNENCIDKLNKIIELHVKISSQNIYGMASLNNDWMHLEEKLDYYQKLRSDYENDFRSILNAGIASGEIVNVKPDVMMFSILTTLRSLYIWIPKKEDINLNDLSNTLSQILINGINK
ncbi:TetR/AcrR family transcriptional regulator [Winogradskyella echinorum]|uniref:TetR/AcrR family transcriptional regulator n=1 Tax=Winogradskyella echinorum TaxID=538189 RepID=A0ABR6Y432_9FLAO|nr:TetR/AcrR family transcriptional regulator [Winogradskyella echinorum]MBC3847493.1 TetR/AcrR family transcriptional regulator [Winogradskyella echinorum]MBC5751841.1 TetR/AcrR family transcriptional regulator [Winogradskyella echinorum]